MITVALIGNPNVGKTALFNRLTGSKQHVANWPGVTVEKKTGRCRHKGEEMEIVDLPGVYSLTASSIDQLIARNFIVEEKPDVIVHIVDATNLERNLYLTLLLLELEANVVLALNMWDLVKARGDQIDVDKLSKLLGIPVVPTVATTGEGVEKLKDEILRVAKEKPKRRLMVGYGEKFEKLIGKLENILKKDEKLAGRYPLRWLAIRILEKDEDVLKKVGESPVKDEVSKVVKVFG